MSKDRIQELEAEIERLRTLAYRDGLTQALTRTAFEETADTFIEEVTLLRAEQRSSFLIKSFSILFIDADNFKNINDTYGHEVGDEVLRRIIQIIESNIRHADLVARWGGEEIVVGLLGAGEKDAAEVAKGIRKDIENISLEHEGVRVTVTVSIGVAEFTREDHTVKKLVCQADEAMYKAKNERGKNAVVCYSELT